MKICIHSKQKCNLPKLTAFMACNQLLYFSTNTDVKRLVKGFFAASLIIWVFLCSDHGLSWGSDIRSSTEPSFVNFELISTSQNTTLRFLLTIRVFMELDMQNNQNQNFEEFWLKQILKVLKSPLIWSLLSRKIKEQENKETAQRNNLL